MLPWMEQRDGILGVRIVSADKCCFVSVAGAASEGQIGLGTVPCKGNRINVFYLKDKVEHDFGGVAVFTAMTRAQRDP